MTQGEVARKLVAAMSACASMAAIGIAADKSDLVRRDPAEFDHGSDVGTHQMTRPLPRSSNIS
jgi:hypothetical protein